MKKRFLGLMFILLLMIPIIVKADTGGRLFYTSVYQDKISNDEELIYFIEYKSRDGVSEGESKVFYVTYDSNKIKYVNASEYETKNNTKIKVTNDKENVLKIEFTAPKDVDKNFAQKIKIKFKPISEEVEGTTTIKITAEYIYEKLTCEDCNGFWLGDVAEGNEERTVTIEKKHISDNINDPDNKEETSAEAEDIKQDIENTEKMKEAPKENNNKSNNYVMYISVGLNGLLLVVLTGFIVNNRKNRT